MNGGCILIMWRWQSYEVTYQLRALLREWVPDGGRPSKHDFQEYGTVVINVLPISVVPPVVILCAVSQTLFYPKGLSLKECYIKNLRLCYEFEGRAVRSK